MNARVGAGRFLVALVALALALTGCTPNLDDRVNTSLEHSIEDAQDTLWEFRDRIASNPEETFADLYFVSDLRDGEGDLSPIRLLDLIESSDGPTLTLLGTGDSQTSAGMWSSQADGAVCFNLTFPRKEKVIRTTPAECPVTAPVEGYDSVIPLEELSPRLVVTQDDYPPPVCQCYSGSPCDCPGG